MSVARGTAETPGPCSASQTTMIGASPHVPAPIADALVIQLTVCRASAEATAHMRRGSATDFLMGLFVRRMTYLGLVASFVVALSGCGEEPVGPDVVGLTLPDAETQLTEAGVAFSTHATDAAFGVIVKENFVVCDVEAVNEQTVRLEVAKRGC